MATSSILALLCLCTTGSATSSVQPAARFSAAATTRSVLLRLRGGDGSYKTLEAGESLDELQAAAGDKLVVVDFTATWCGPCQRIAPVFAELAEQYAESCTFVKVDVDEHGELTAALGVSSLPTFLFFRGGEQIDMLRGADEEGLRNLVSKHSGA